MSSGKGRKARARLKKYTEAAKARRIKAIEVERQSIAARRGATKFYSEKGAKE